jgi:GR25 family glycosyltransferase involved in LPS biosynthesis
MFSSGVANTSVAIAELFQGLGHEVALISLTGNIWWDDCQEAKGLPVVPLDSAKDFDVVFEIDRMMLSAEKRRAVAKRAVWVLRHPFILGELEATLFPVGKTPKRELEGLSQVWLFDTAVEEGAVQSLELLTRVPVHLVPFLWTHTIAEAHMNSMQISSWIEATVKELRRLQGSTDAVPPWKPHVTETNTTNASSSVIPLVILREAQRRGFRMGAWKIHNTEVIEKSKFFMENIVKHCTDLEGTSYDLVGRQRSVEWALEPMSCVVTHSRFTGIRPVLLDVAWAGIPLIHNSPALRDIGKGLETLYYSDNHIDEACKALQKMEHDMVTLKGVFAPGATEAVRAALKERFGPTGAAKSVWGGLMDSLIPVSSPMAQVIQVAASTPVTGSTLRVGFSDMWESFVPEYNFFTLMLSAAGAKLDPPVQVVGEPATPDSSIVIFGPFGELWRKLPESQPKVHFTGENTVPIKGPGVGLNLGFHHFDMVSDDYLRFPLWLLEIDWFGADAARIVNPKPIPLDLCTKVDAGGLGRKKKFCAFVVSNPNNPVRNAAFQWLSEYKPVDSAGRVMNNMGDRLFAGAGGGGGEQKKVEFLKDYKFCLAYENNSARGYTTEKFLHAKAAGCIPIYWGDSAIERDFSLAGAIDARNVKTQEELVALVRAVDESDSEWLRRYAVPALDSYRVAWCHRTMAECARRVFGLGGFAPKSFPKTVGDVAVAAPAAAPIAAPAAAPAPVAQPTSQLEVPLMVTCVNRRFLPSLQQWLTSLSTQASALPGLKALVYHFSDVPEDTIDALKERFSFAMFKSLPTAAPFPDFWEPHNYGWKLWILQELAVMPELTGVMIMYTDAASFLCRWPKDWMFAAQDHGVCLLEDPREENRRWCSTEFCAALDVTEAELNAQQIQAATICFRAGSQEAVRLFTAAFQVGSRREALVGPKWAGQTPEGKPFGHRHDQSILSILSARQRVKRLPVDSVQCCVSLRKTFTTGRSIYLHRGSFTVQKPFTDGIDDAYVINLERRADRLKGLWSNSPELEGRVERWGAIDGRGLVLTPAIARLLKPNDFFWKKAIAGCALSHLGLWHKLAHETPDINNYLILEDDVKFRQGWEATWKSVVAAGDVPEDYDILYLGGVLPPNRTAFDTIGKERFNNSFCRVKENSSWGQVSPSRYFHFCAYAYVLSKRGAQKVLELMEGYDGYWTSADHILCNPVTVLKSYVLDPMVAGCYQDDDPKYATSQFNDFSRIDGFDSDLWNNDERWTPGEVESLMSDVPLDIKKALDDARALAPVVAPAPAPAPAAAPEPVPAPEPAPAPPLTAPRAPSKPEVPLLKRVVTLSSHPLQFNELYEGDWLLELLGHPTAAPIESVKFEAPPPDDCPIVILQKPHIDVITCMLERWDSFGAKFQILHLSDEHGDDSLNAYELKGCTNVLRFYQRKIPCPEKVTFLPLGYHWTRREPHQDILVKTPKLPFRQTAWSFFGTEWNGRKELLKPMLDLDLTQKTLFLSTWKDPEAYTREQYVEAMLDTVFVPCPDGQNPETFRFYEALEFGCIPLLVRTEKNAAWVDWVCENIQLLPLASWADAAQLVAHLMKEKTMLEAYRNKIMISWMVWKKGLFDEVKSLVI